MRIGSIKLRYKAIGLSTMVLIVVAAFAIPFLSYQTYFKAGVNSTLWSHFYLGNTESPLIIETDYEENHPISSTDMSFLVTEMGKVCDRPIVWEKALTNTVNLPNTFINLDNGYVDHNMLTALRSTLETSDVVYIIFSDNSYMTGENAIGGIFSPPGSLVTMIESKSLGIERIVLIHEIGHLLGLDHDDSSVNFMNSVINPSNLPASWSQISLNKLDEIRGYDFHGGSSLVEIWIGVIDGDKSKIG